MFQGADIEGNMAGKMKQYITNSDIYSTEEKNNLRQNRNTTFFKEG